MTAPLLSPDDFPGAAERPKLLVVDDQPVNIQVLYQAFADDCQVFMATGGEQALRLAHAKQPDLVLLDVVMPGLDGYQVCQAMQADEALRRIPVIFVTAQHDEEAEAIGLDVGAVDFISKPINPRIVRARVRTHLTLKHQADLLRRWVYVDGLTGVANRRYFDEQLVLEARRAMRDARPMSVAMVDVDHFKRYNDCHGHHAGDECLRRVADGLRHAGRRSGDLLARYGGEEFALVLPATDVAGAAVMAQRLVQGVRDLALPHGADGARTHVSVSVGFATWEPGTPIDVERLMKHADTALYDAKAQGRDGAVGGAVAHAGAEAGVGS